MKIVFFDFQPTPFLEQNMPLLIEAHNTLFDIWGFVNLLSWLSLGHDSDIMLDEHDSPQLHDIVHFEYKLSWFWASPKYLVSMEIVFFNYKLIIIS